MIRIIGIVQSSIIFFNDTATTEIYTYDTLFPYTTLFRSAEFQLWGLYVDAGYRGSHVAATLVCSALQWCRRQRDARPARKHLRRDEHRVRRLCPRKWF